MLDTHVGVPAQYKHRCRDKIVWKVYDISAEGVSVTVNCRLAISNEASRYIGVHRLLVSLIGPATPGWAPLRRIVGFRVT